MMCRSPNSLVDISCRRAEAGFCEMPQMLSIDGATRRLRGAFLSVRIPHTRSALRPRSPRRSSSSRTANSAPSPTVRGSGLDLPNQVTTQVEIQGSTVTMVSNLVLDLRARDWLIASDAYAARSVTSARSRRLHLRELTFLDALTDAGPYRSARYLRFRDHCALYCRRPVQFVLNIGHVLGLHACQKKYSRANPVRPRSRNRYHLSSILPALRAVHSQATSLSVIFRSEQAR